MIDKIKLFLLLYKAINPNFYFKGSKNKGLVYFCNEVAPIRINNSILFNLLIYKDQNKLYTVLYTTYNEKKLGWRI